MSINSILNRLCYLLSRFQNQGLKLLEVVFCIVPRLSHGITVDKDFLMTTHINDSAQLAIRVSQNTIHGRLTYTKLPGGASKSTRVELVVKLKHRGIRAGIATGETTGLRIGTSSGLVVREVLAELKDPGTLDFVYQLPKVEDTTVIVGVHTYLTLKKIIETLGLVPPVILGSGWKLVEAKNKAYTRHTKAKGCS